MDTPIDKMLTRASDIAVDAIWGELDPSGLCCLTDEMVTKADKLRKEIMDLGREMSPVPEVKVIREGVQFGFRDDLECSNCGQDLDLQNSCKDDYRPRYCPNCGGKIKWE